MTDLSRAHGPGQVVSHRFYAMDVCGQRLGTLGHRRRIDDAVKSDLRIQHEWCISGSGHHSSERS